MPGVCKSLEDEVTQLQSDRQILIEALEWYANRVNYLKRPLDDFAFAPPAVLIERGSRAIEALAKVKE